MYEYEKLLHKKTNILTIDADYFSEIQMVCVTDKKFSDISRNESHGANIIFIVGLRSYDFFSLSKKTGLTLFFDRNFWNTNPR